MLKHQFRANNRCKIDASIRKDISGHYVNNTQIHCDLWNKIFINFMIYHIFLSNIICTMYKYTCKQYWSYCWNFVLLCACVGWWMRVCVCEMFGPNVWYNYIVKNDLQLMCAILQSMDYMIVLYYFVKLLHRPGFLWIAV